jgi:hypothetical protein
MGGAIMASVPPSKIKVTGAGAKKAHGKATCIRRAMLLEVEMILNSLLRP